MIGSKRIRPLGVKAMAAAAGIIVAIWILVPPSAQAGIMLAAENRDTVDGWPVTPQIETRSPTGTQNNTVSITASSAISQTFTVVSDFTLRTISMTYSSSTAGTYGVQLFRIDDPDNLNYSVIGSDLLTTGLQFSTTAGSSGLRILSLTLTGTDQVNLTAGNYYAFELSLISGGNINMWRSGSSSYGGGAVYVNGTALNHPDGGGTGTRDVTLALSSDVIPEPASAVLCLVGFSLMACRRR